MNDGAADELASKVLSSWARGGSDAALTCLMDGGVDLLLRRSKASHLPDSTRASQDDLEKHAGEAKAVAEDQIEAALEDQRATERIIADRNRAMQAIRALDGPLVRMVYQPGPVFRDACDGIMRLQATLLAKYGYGANR